MTGSKRVAQLVADVTGIVGDDKTTDVRAIVEAALKLTLDITANELAEVVYAVRAERASTWARDVLTDLP